MRSLVCFLCGLVLSGLAVPCFAIDQKTMIEHVKGFPVSKIRSGSRSVGNSLPTTPLAQWLAEQLGTSELTWEVDDCGEGGGRPGGQVPACVSVYTPPWHCPEVFVSFIVASDYDSNEKPGEFYLWYGGASDFGGIEQRIKTLGDLPATVRAVAKKASALRPAELPHPSLKKMSKQDIVNRAKAIDVHTLDSSLPSERLDRWFARMAHWPISFWPPESNLRHCGPNALTVRATPSAFAKGSGPPADLTVTFGSWEQGIAGQPTLSLVFGKTYGRKSGDAPAEFPKTLHEFGEKLDAWAIAHHLRRYR